MYKLDLNAIYIHTLNPIPHSPLVASFCDGYRRVVPYSIRSLGH